MPQTKTLQKKAIKRALIVEDEGEMGLLLNLFIDEGELQLDYVKNLLSAEEYLQKEQPMVIILDNKLPDGFGVDFIGFVKKNYPGIKIIMISGFGSVRDVAIENGADAFLEKPFSRAQLFQVLHDIVPA